MVVGSAIGNSPFGARPLQGYDGSSNTTITGRGEHGIHQRSPTCRRDHQNHPGPPTWGSGTDSPVRRCGRNEVCESDCDVSQRVDCSIGRAQGSVAGCGGRCCRAASKTWATFFPNSSGSPKRPACARAHSVAAICAISTMGGLPREIHDRPARGVGPCRVRQPRPAFIRPQLFNSNSSASRTFDCDAVLEAWLAARVTVLPLANLGIAAGADARAQLRHGQCALA